MKPNFALKLSHDGVEILQRAASGWMVTGSTRFDAADLDGKLRHLREQAEALSPDGLRAKLIMPDSEVRYASVVAPGPTDEARRLQIESEIEGLTPYALHELAYDYVVEGDYALVAICAREILAEAEGFAQTHGFNPVSFAAIPPAGAFAGEPFFGEAAGARAFLPRNASVERDREPVRVAGQPKPAEPPRPAPPLRPAATAKPAPAAERPVPAGAPAVPSARTAGAVAASAAPEAFSRVGSLVRRMGTRIRREQAQAATDGASAKPAQPASAQSKPQSAPQAAPQSTAPKTDTATPGIQADKSNVAAASAPTPDTSSPAKPTEPQSGSKAEPVAFSSRRSPPAPGAAPAATGPALVSDGPGARAGKPNPGGRIAVMPGGDEKVPPGRMTRLYRRGRRAAKGALVSVGLVKAAEGRGKRRGGRRTDPAQAAPLVPASAPPASERAKASEAEAMTIFGARNMQRTETGFARRGLMLTGGLLLLLLAVAIWAVYFTSGPARETGIAQAPQDTVSALPPIDAPAGITAPAPVPAPAEEETPVPEPEAIAPPPAEAEVEVEAEAPVAEQTTDPDVLLEELVQEALTQAMPVDLLGQTEDTAVPPGEAEAPGTAEETALEGVDSAPVMPDVETATDQRLALPPVLDRPELTEVAPVSPPPPPPFGAEFTLGPDGLVEATPEGAMTPSGVTVFAGPPSEVPPARPAGIAPPAPAPAEPEAAPEAGEAEPAVAPEPEAQVQTPEETEAAVVIEDDTPRADPALAGFRPQSRSPLVAALAAAAAANDAEGDPAPDATPETATPDASDPDDDSAAATPTPGGVLLDGLRPQRRPTDLVTPTDAATETATDAAAEVDPGVVAVSLRPTARPGNLSARVQESLAAARAPAAAAPAAAAPAAAAPAPTASAAPNIPTTASVAQQATQARAINLRRVNLIGVFGTPNDRRALVRLSNGQVVRVQVGDRLDGGQVSAIGDNELRYVKNGRNEVLRIGSSG